MFWAKILKFFDVDPGSGMEKVQIQDPEWKKVGSGMKTCRIRNTGWIFISMEKTVVSTHVYVRSARNGNVLKDALLL
jgi:hypothetical protein